MRYTNKHTIDYYVAQNSDWQQGRLCYRNNFHPADLPQQNNKTTHTYSIQKRQMGT